MSKYIQIKLTWNQAAKLDILLENISGTSENERLNRILRAIRKNLKKATGWNTDLQS